MNIWWKVAYVLYDLLFIGEIVMIVLNAFNLIDWNWIWVLLPMLIVGLLTMLVVFILGNIILAIDGYNKKIEKEKDSNEKN